MKRIGILGGTFNPIHIGHLAIAETARQQLNLEKVFFIPSFIPPHKKDKDLIHAKHRYVMVKLAIEHNRHLKVSAAEIKRKGKSYSIDTVKEFKQKFPGVKIFFIIGGDAYQTLKQWKSIQELVKITKFVVVHRPHTIEKKHLIQCRFIHMPGLDISSSYIRSCIKKKESIKYLVPEKVLHYIKKHKLYHK